MLLFKYIILWQLASIIITNFHLKTWRHMCLHLSQLNSTRNQWFQIIEYVIISLSNKYKTFEQPFKSMLCNFCKFNFSCSSNTSSIINFNYYYRCLLKVNHHTISDCINTIQFSQKQIQWKLLFRDLFVGHGTFEEFIRENEQQEEKSRSRTKFRDSSW